MNWTWDSFWAMGGYGWYVWMSYGLCLGFIMLEWLGLRRGERQMWRELRRRAVLQDGVVEGLVDEA